MTTIKSTWFSTNRGLLFALGIAISACTPVDTGVTEEKDQPGLSESRRFNDWLDTEFAAEMDFSPLGKTRLGDKEDYGELDDVSEAALDRRVQWQRDSVARMAVEFDRGRLDVQAQLSWDLWQYRLDITELNRPFRRHRFIFGRNGPQSRLPNSLVNYHKVTSLADMEAYISRLAQSGRYMRQYLRRAELAAEDGIRAPYFDYDRTLSEIRRVTTGAPFTNDGSSALWMDITAKIASLAEIGLIDVQQGSDLTRRAQAALLEEFQPAYDEIAHWIEADRAYVSETASGAWSLPDGERYYAARLATYTTLDMSAAEIHEIGLAEVARIHEEMKQVKAQVGFDGSLQAFFEFMREDEQFYMPNTEQGRDDYLKLADEHLSQMYARLPNYFGILPKAKLQVKRVEAFREHAGGAAHYARGTKDGSRPGTFYVHLADMRALAVNRLENLSYHEGVPGHHMQLSIQQELENIPRFRRVRGYTAFSEGWGLYAELLAKEMGGYADPYADFGRLSGEIWRAVRLVVDTGIHAMHWTEEQAVGYAMENSSRPELSVRSEMRRYFNNPGQATAYKIGMLKILALRARAESVQADKFDIKAFHDVVLGSGPLPMGNLDMQIDRWLSED